MGKLRVCLVLAILSLGACGSDSANKPDASIVIVDAAADAKEFLDAPPPTYDFACTTNPAPTMAAAMITLSGTVQRVEFNGSVMIVAVSGATLKACAAGAQNCNGGNQHGNTATSASDGTYSIGPFNTGDVPVDAYVEMTETQSRTTFVYPDEPFRANQTVPVLTFSPFLIGLLSNFGCTQDPAKGMLALAVADCNDMGISDSANVMLSIKQNNTEVMGTTAIDLGMFNAQAAGAFLVCNVPAGEPTTVGATYMSTMFRSHDVKVVAGATTATLIRPGYRM